MFENFKFPLKLKCIEKIRERETRTKKQFPTWAIDKDAVKNAKKSVAVTERFDR